MEFQDRFKELFYVADEFDLHTELAIRIYYDGPVFLNILQVIQLRDHLNKVLEDAPPSP